MELLIISLLIIPFAMACFAGLYGILQHAAQAAHNRHMERLRVEGEVYNFPADSNGNHNARYIPSIGRVIHPNSGNQGPEYPQLTHFTYSPNNSSSMSGKPLQVGGDQRNQSALVINRWRGKPEGSDNYNVDVEANQTSQEGPQSAELPEPSNEPPLEEDTLPPEQAALGLLSEGLSIREVVTATGLSFHTVRTLRQQLNLKD